MVAWQTGDILRSRVYDRVTLAPGSEITLPSLAGDLEGFDITADGRIAAVYRQDSLIQGQIFDAAGQPLGPLLEVELSETNIGGDTVIGIFVGSEHHVIYWMVEETTGVTNTRAWNFSALPSTASRRGRRSTS